MKRALTARRLRIILIVTMVLVILGAGGGFIYAKTGLDSYVASIRQLNADADSGNSNIVTLKNLKTKLEQEQTLINKTHAIIADNSTYADTIINSITDIANSSGVAMTSLEFVDDAAAATTGTAAPATTTPAAPSTTPVLAGVTKKSITVTLKSPLSYSSLMKFLAGIEMSTPKMQINTVTLSKDTGDNVATQAFTIQVYVRS